LCWVDCVGLFKPFFLGGGDPGDELFSTGHAEMPFIGFAFSGLGIIASDGGVKYFVVGFFAFGAGLHGWCS